MPFDGTTTQRHDYPAWEIHPDPPAPKQPWRSSGGKFDAETTNKTDFRDMGAQPRYQRKPQAYVPNSAKFEGISSNREAFKNWEIVSRPMGRHSAPYVPLKDDRDFKSTNAAAYIDHPHDQHVEHKVSQSRTAAFHPPPPSSKFDSATTSGEAYRHWDIKPRDRTPKAQWIPNRSKFATETTYSTNFVVKSMPPGTTRPTKFGPTYTPVASSKFEGVSTHKADYLPTDHPHKLPDFAPKKQYVNQKDDRDFVTTHWEAYEMKSKMGR
ncbi:hypothetical protein BC830DRAFT_426804 [Chytriomyces sp. MP71]|nr:hypothetical protein BC830DRAFT_426804 [Chytriomyces sp. MP71]